mmetsp:Transcript_25610/g.60924  ORF Transcript_25610/g.60924 Transcript_25610/m.60924 type:complete len:441 (+) Transcript_25610:1188-2510(+)
MRYCVSSRCGCTPAATRWSKRLTLSPPSSASREMMVGGSWQWSPTSATCLAPRTRGTSVLGSVACEASSRSTEGKVSFPSISLPAPLQVAHTTCARRSAATCAWWKASRSLRSACRAAWDSSMCGRRSERTDSGRPTRTTAIPAAASPPTRLSTAMFESLVASTGPCPDLSQSEIRLIAVCVFPVPGGPWTRVRRCEMPARRAFRWEALRFSLRCTSPAALPTAKGAVPLGGEEHICGTAAVCASRSSVVAQPNPAQTMPRSAASMEAWPFPPEPPSSSTARRASSFRVKVTLLVRRKTLTRMPQSRCTDSSEAAPITLTVNCGKTLRTSASLSSLAGGPPPLAPQRGSLCRGPECDSAGGLCRRTVSPLMMLLSLGRAYWEYLPPWSMSCPPLEVADVWRPLAALPELSSACTPTTRAFSSAWAASSANSMTHSRRKCE